MADHIPNSFRVGIWTSKKDLYPAALLPLFYSPLIDPNDHAFDAGITWMPGKGRDRVFSSTGELMLELTKLNMDYIPANLIIEFV